MTAPLHEAEQRAREIGRAIKAAMPEGWGFTLMLFTFGDGGNTTWITTARREDAIKAIRELADRLERGEAGE